MTMRHGEQFPAKPGDDLARDVGKWVYGRHQIRPRDVVRSGDLLGQHTYPRASLIRYLGRAELRPLARGKSVDELAYKLRQAALNRPASLKYAIGSLTIEQYGPDDFMIEAHPTEGTANVLTRERNAIIDELGLEVVGRTAPSVPLAKSSFEDEINDNLGRLRARFNRGDLHTIDYGPIVLENHIPNRVNHR